MGTSVGVAQFDARPQSVVHESPFGILWSVVDSPGVMHVHILRMPSSSINPNLFFSEHFGRLIRDILPNQDFDGKLERLDLERMVSPYRDKRDPVAKSDRQPPVWFLDATHADTRTKEYISSGIIGKRFDEKWKSVASRLS